MEIEIVKSMRDYPIETKITGIKKTIKLLEAVRIANINLPEYDCFILGLQKYNGYIGERKVIDIKDQNNPNLLKWIELGYLRIV